MLSLVFISSFGYIKKLKYKTSTTSEETPKLIVSSLKCACLSIYSNSSSIWIQSNRWISIFMNLPPRALKCCYSKSTSWHILLVLVARTLYPLLDPIWSLMDYWAEMNYLLCMKESNIRQHLSVKDCYFTWQFQWYSICSLTNMYI